MAYKECSAADIKPGSSELAHSVVINKKWVEDPNATLANTTIEDHYHFLARQGLIVPPDDTPAV